MRMPLEQGTPPMQSTQPLNSAQTQQEADPHDVFAIESILAGRADHRAPPLAHDPASQPAAPPVHVAPEISVAAVVTPQVEPEFRAIDVNVSNLRRKIEQEPRKPKRLVTVRGIGYKLVAS